MSGEGGKMGNFSENSFLYMGLGIHTREWERGDRTHTLLHCYCWLIQDTTHYEWENGDTTLEQQSFDQGQAFWVEEEREREKLCKYSRWNDSRTDSKKKKICCCDVARCWNLINIPPSQPRLTPSWLWLQPFFSSSHSLSRSASSSTLLDSNIISHQARKSISKL